MAKKKTVWKIVFLILSLITLFALLDRIVFLTFREKTEAQILSLTKSDDENKLIVELNYNIGSRIIHNTKEIKYSFNEDFKDKKHIEIFYNEKSPKKIYFVNYGPNIYTDIIIILIPCLLFIFGFIRALKE